MSDSIPSNQDLTELLWLCNSAESTLRLFAANCQGCQGAGVVVYGHSDEDSWEETCMSCKPLHDLLDYLAPKPEPKPQPQPEVDDDIAF